MSNTLYLVKHVLYLFCLVEYDLASAKLHISGKRTLKFLTMW